MRLKCTDTSCFLSKGNPGEGQWWSCGGPVLWPAAQHRTCWPHTQRHTGNLWRWMALGNLLHTPKTEGLVWELEFSLSSTHLGEQQSWEQLALHPSRKAISTNTYIRGHDFLHKFCLNFAKVDDWALPRGKASRAMFDSADSLEWALHSTATSCACVSSPEAPAQTHATGWRVRNKAHRTCSQRLLWASSLGHKASWDATRLAGIAGKQKAWSCFQDYLYLSLPAFPLPYPGLQPQESQPGSAGSLMESSTTRVARGILF